MGIKTTCAVCLCKASYRLMHMLGKTGRSLPGKLALKLDNQLIAELAKDRKIIVITGTNGKTTTTHIVTQGVKNAFGDCAHDPSSTNLAQGITTTLALDSTLKGAPLHQWAVIECDEGAAKRVLPQLKPDVLIVTNLYKDQIDRYATQTTARDYIAQALKACPETIAVLDADCQVVASLADETENPVIWFGASGDVYQEGVADQDPQVACVKCGGELAYQHRNFAHLGDYFCPSCGYTHHEPQFDITKVFDAQEKSCQISLNWKGETLETRANVRAGYDVYNVAAAAAGLWAAGVPRQAILEAIGKFKHAMSRFEIFDVEGQKVRLLLMKNTAGCNQVINMISTEAAHPKHLLLLLNAEICDGTGTQWIEDVRWERLCQGVSHIMVGGKRKEDLLQRLQRAQVSSEVLEEIEYDMSDLVKKIAALQEPVTVIANCSALADFRAELSKHYQPFDYWSEGD